MIVPIEQRGAVSVYEDDGLVIACAPADLAKNEVLDDVDGQRPADAPWDAYAQMTCNHEHPHAAERKHWLLTGADE